MRRFLKVYGQPLWMAVGALAALTLLLLSGCRAGKSATETHSEKDTLVMWRVRADTVTINEPATAALRLLLECDERSNALAVRAESRVAEEKTENQVSFRETLKIMSIGAFFAIVIIRT